MDSLFTNKFSKFRPVVIVWVGTINILILRAIPRISVSMTGPNFYLSLWPFYIDHNPGHESPPKFFSDVESAGKIPSFAKLKKFFNF
jgi:hypothetical protein